MTRYINGSTRMACLPIGWSIFGNSRKMGLMSECNRVELIKQREVEQNEY